METHEDYMNVWAKAENEIYEKNQEVLNLVKEMVSQSFFEELEEYLEECDNTSQYNLTNDSPNDKHKQDESDYELIKVVWVNQYRNGGYTGDNFAGQIWIKITNEKYFTFHYEM